MTSQAMDRSGAALRQILVRAIAGGLVFSAVFTAFGTWGVFSTSASSENHTIFEWLVAVAAAVVAGAVVWMTGKAGTVPGNTGGAANRSLIFGIVAAISFPVFWLGIYPLFAAGSFVLGGSAVREGAGGTKAKAIIGMVLAALATVFCAALNLFG